MLQRIYGNMVTLNIDLAYKMLPLTELVEMKTN